MLALSTFVSEARRYKRITYVAIIYHPLSTRIAGCPPHPSAEYIVKR
jgi:hypothetical protein